MGGAESALGLLSTGRYLLCVDVYGWMGGYLVVPTLHLPGTFTFTLPILSFLSMMGGLFYLFFYLFFLFSGLFLLGAIFKESPLIILQRKIPGKATKFPEVWSWECALPT